MESTNLHVFPQLPLILNSTAFGGSDHSNNKQKKVVPKRLYTKDKANF